MPLSLSLSSFTHNSRSSPSVVSPFAFRVEHRHPSPKLPLPQSLPPSPQPGNGVDLLRDGRTDTYWQSDGNPPHLINIQFQRKVRRGKGGGGQKRDDDQNTPNRRA